MTYSILLTFRSAHSIAAQYIYSCESITMLSHIAAMLGAAHSGETVSMQIKRGAEILFSLPNAFRADDIYIVFDLLQRS